MKTRTGRLALGALLSLLALPVRAEKPDAPLPAQDSKDLCSYLKDVDAKTDAACAPDALLALKAQDRNGFAEKLAFAAKRKTDVQRAFEHLKASPAKAGTEMPSLQPPINERTFPAWLGDKALELKPVYARLLDAQNQQLKKQAAAEASPERKAEIERALASNRAKIASLQKIKDPAQLNCFLGDTCGNRGDVTGAGSEIAGGSRGAWTRADFDQANAEAKRETVAPGGKIGSVVPALTPVADSPDGKSSPRNGSPLLPISIPLGLGLVGYGVYRSRNKDASLQEIVPAGALYKPTFSSDPVGVISGYVLSAKIAMEDKPVQTMGAIGVLAIGGLYLGGSLLMGAGGEGAATLAPLAATAGAAPTAGAGTAELGGVRVISEAAKTLARVGGAVAAVKAVSDGISYAASESDGSGTTTGQSTRSPRKRDELLGKAQDPELRDAIDNLYRDKAKVGDGSSMDAYRYESETDIKLSKNGHGGKLIDRREQLVGILHKASLSSADRQIAKDLLIDIQNALSGR